MHWELWSPLYIVLQTTFRQLQHPKQFLSFRFLNGPSCFLSRCYLLSKQLLKNKTDNNDYPHTQTEDRKYNFAPYMLCLMTWKYCVFIYVSLKWYKKKGNTDLSAQLGRFCSFDFLNDLLNCVMEFSNESLKIRKSIIKRLRVNEGMNELDCKNTVF